MDNKNLKTRIMTAFAWEQLLRNLELTCHSEGTNVTEESMMCHCEEQPNNSFLPFIRGGLRRGDSSFETPIIKVFQKKKKDSTSSPALTAEPYPHLYGSISRQQLIYPLKEGKGVAAFTLSCKTFSSDSSQAKLTQPPAQSSQTKFRSRAAHSYGFTLAETMIVLVILGIVAAITIPALVRRQVEASNRTRIKKAMTVYDTALNKMVIENGIKSNDALINEFNADKNNNSCAKSRAYFKSAQDGANDCTFRASDGVWWNIEDITHPIIAFNEDDLNKADEENNKAFHLVGYLDDNGSLRVSDLAKAEGDNQEYLTKLYNFVNNKKDSSSGGGEEKPKSFLDNCVKIDDTHYNCGGTTFIPKTGNGACVNITTGPLKGTQSCGPDENTTVWVPENPITSDIYVADAKSDENCATSTHPNCKKYGDFYNAAKRYCESKGTHLATVGELKSLGYTRGLFWAAEEIDSTNAYSLLYGGVYDINKFNGYDFVCVGN